MVVAARSLRPRPAWQLPANLLGASLAPVPTVGPELEELYPEQPLFAERDVRELQVRLARAQKENERLRQALRERSLVSGAAGIRPAAHQGPRAPSAGSLLMPSLLAMTNSAFDPASRVRLIQFIPGLEKAGWKVDHRPNVPDRQWSSPLSGRWSRAAHYRMGRARMKWNRWHDVSEAGRFDAVFVNRDLAGRGTPLREAGSCRETRASSSISTTPSSSAATRRRSPGCALTPPG